MPNALSKVFNIGPTIVGKILGDAYKQYRPTTALNPIVDGNILAQIPAWITPDPKGNASRAPTYAKPTWFGMFDPTVTNAGDYLVGPLGTFFISSQNVPQPIQVVLCNAIVSIFQPSGVSGFGVQLGYGGDQRSTETPMATNWPASLLQGTKGEVGNTKLPGDAKMPWVALLLPAIPGVTFRNNLVIVDEEGTRYIMSSTELSALGWRITAMRATT